jgi:hypothetical protein
MTPACGSGNWKRQCHKPHPHGPLVPLVPCPGSEAPAAPRTSTLARLQQFIRGSAATDQIPADDAGAPPTSCTAVLYGRGLQMIAKRVQAGQPTPACSPRCTGSAPAPPIADAAAAAFPFAPSTPFPSPRWPRANPSKASAAPKTANSAPTTALRTATGAIAARHPPVTRTHKHQFGAGGPTGQVQDSPRISRPL